MKKIFCLLFLGFACILNTTKAQQDPMYSQYMFNTLSVNPAYAGTKKAINVILLRRGQWAGFEGAPKTNTLTIHSPIGKSNLGAGFSIVHDKIGPVKVTNMFLDLASELQVYTGHFVSVGIKIGFDTRRANLSDLEPLENSDPTYAADAIADLNPNLGTGIYYYTKKYYVGFSIPKINKSKIEDKNIENGINEQLERHYFLIGGYVHDINEDYKLKPTILAKKVKNAPGSLDLSLSAIYKEQVISGLSYRFGDSFGAQIQFRVFQQFWIGYAYDFTISELSKFNSGTHELMIYLDTEWLKKGIIKSPRFF